MEACSHAPTISMRASACASSPGATASRISSIDMPHRRRGRPRTHRSGVRCSASAAASSRAMPACSCLSRQQRSTVVVGVPSGGEASQRCRAQLRDVPAVLRERVERALRGGAGSVAELGGTQTMSSSGSSTTLGALVGIEPGGELERRGARGADVAAEPVARQRERAQRRPQRGGGRAGARALEADLAEVQLRRR